MPTKKEEKPTKPKTRKAASTRKKATVVQARKKPAAKAEAEPKKQPKNKYIAAIGRRKEAIVRARLYPVRDGGVITVNGRELKEYFPNQEFYNEARGALTAIGLEGKFNVRAQAKGGGIHGQAVALRLATARALLEHDPNLRKSLRALGYMTRDPRAKERKKPGLKRARRAPQWQKR